ncbi:MAG: macro domain-containing protein [Candidatus Omnitrophica bacterium]|nr:macro domain-containing protein [Candidatus Omnitrophota bacterium]
MRESDSGKNKTIKGGTMNIRNIEIEVIKGDITDLDVDAIVNPANVELMMEKGLAGCINQKGGGAIEEEALSKAPVDVGEAVVTKAGRLKARHIIHAVTVANDGTDQEIVRHAAANALKRAQELKAQAVAFPALGCGIGGFPLVGSAKIMVQEILRFAREGRPSLGKIIFCLNDRKAFEIFETTVYEYLRHVQEDLGPGPYVTVDIIIECKEGVVLIERSNPPYGWALPGGFIAYGESLEEAAIREAKEETNLDLINLRQFHTYSDPGRDPRFHTISTVFVAEGQGVPISGDDAKNLKIVRYEDLTELDYAFDHKRIIKEYLIERNFT